MNRVRMNEVSNRTDVTITARSYHLNDCILFHGHDFYEFEYIVSGHGVHYVNNCCYEVKPGDFWGLGLNDYHRYENTDVELCNLILLYPRVSPEIKTLLRQQSFPLYGNIPENRRQHVESWFACVEETYRCDSPFREKRLTGAVLVLLSEYLTYACPAKETDHDQSAYRYVHAALQFIANHSHEAITLRDTAMAVNISAAYLSHIFTDYTGCHFTEYLNQLRVQNACNLLVEGQFSVTEIAYRTGFGSVSNLNRAFQRYQGTSPSLFRKKNT